MFEGTSFKSVASHLIDRGNSPANSEAMLRTSVGRCYYACFHAMRARFVVPKDLLDTHKTSHWKLVERASKELKGDVADWYKQLYILRKHADYHHWRDKHESPPYPPCGCPWDEDCYQNAKHASELADMILEWLASNPK